MRECNDHHVAIGEQMPCVRDVVLAGVRVEKVTSGYVREPLPQADQAVEATCDSRRQD